MKTTPTHLTALLLAPIMQTFVRSWLSLFILCSAASAQETWTKTDVDRLMTDLSNWGKWGADDQMGTLNYITPEVRQAAAKLVKEGITVSLSRDAAQTKAPDNGSPYEHNIAAAIENQGWNGGSIKVAYHGLAHTHLDALCHKVYGGKMYNGYSYKTVTANGAEKNSIIKLKAGVFSRAVLIDIPLLKGVDYLEPGTAIFAKDLDAWEKHSGVTIGAGDIVLVRTGHWKRRDKLGAAAQRPGLHVSCVPWLHDRKAAMIGTDLALDVSPSQVRFSDQPVHQLCLVALGMPVLDCADLEQLSIEAAKRKRWAFLISMAPLAVDGATGSPINPIVTF
jgi:kynurenine formamidase